MTYSYLLIVKNGNHDTLLDQKQLGIVSVRIMVHEWPLASSSNLQLIVVQEEVTDIDEKQATPIVTLLLQVKQDEVIEIDLLVKDQQVLRHTNYTVPLEESMLYSSPRNNDILFTLPNFAGKALFFKTTNQPTYLFYFYKIDVESPLQTTSHYLLRQVETTVDEQTMPGKLPETPLRTDSPSSYKVCFCHNDCEWGILQLDANVIPVAAISLLPATPEKINNIEEKCI
ncbi:hypothetical protein Chor_006614 [Crotalus horridus]